MQCASLRVHVQHYISTLLEENHHTVAVKNIVRTMAIVGRGRERVVGRVRVYYMSGQSWRAPLSKNWEFADQGTITRQQVDRPLLPNRNHSCVCSVTVLCVRRGVHLKMSQRQDTISPSPCPHPMQIRKRTIQVRPCAIPHKASSRGCLDLYRHDA